MARKVNSGVLMEYRHVFDDQPQEINHYLQGLNRDLVLRACNIFTKYNYMETEQLIVNYFGEPQN